MLTKIFLIFLAVLIFQSCNLSTSKFEKDQSIGATTRQEIKILNDKLFEGIIKNNLAAVQSLMSPGLLEKFGNDSNKVISRINDLKIDNYSILDEYSVQASATAVSITLESGNNDDNDYIFTFGSPNTNSYVSLLLLSNFGNQFLLTAIYGKYQNEWKLNVLKVGRYSFFGKTAIDYFQLAEASYKKAYLIDAVNDISISSECLQPSGEYWQFVKEKQIKEFEDSLLKEASANYKLPMTLVNVDSKPQVFRILPQVIKEGFFPMVYYLTDVNLKDTIALKRENEKVRKAVDSIFTGIDRDKQFIFYWAFNELPEGQKAVHRYGFIDTLIKK